MDKKHILFVFLMGCTVDSATDTDEYLQQALQLQDEVTADSSGLVAATITFDGPTAVATVADLADRHRLDVVGTYVYAQHDDG
ncbi:MAG: hypothetical protein KC431_21350, partial [Myxococcales bacterium]|nr:hypothetical protein [Myxococcales bacterium]